MGMIDIADKVVTDREAVVEGVIYMRPAVVRAIKEGKVPKGDVLQSARIAGIMAAKNTPYMIPLCHPLPIDGADLEFFLGKNKVTIRAKVRARAKTGVEMEAMAAAALAALTIYDMCKMLDKEMVVSDIRLLKKTGGKSGIYIRRRP